MLKTPSHSRADKKSSLMNVFKKGSKDGETPNTAPNTPEEETGVTVVANEIDPAQELLAPLTLQEIPSPLRGDHASDSTKSSAIREEKKEEPSVSGDQTVEDVVSKTLNFFDDMCTLPQIPQIATDRGVQAVATSSIKKHSHLLTQESSCPGAAYDDNTTSPSLPSETTGNSSADPSTRYSNSYVSSSNINNKNSSIKKKDKPVATAHDHENFEVVLDPASMTKEENEFSGKQQLGKRWNRISKSLASSLSVSQKKEKNQPMSPSPRNDSTFGSPHSGKNNAQTKESSIQTREEADDAPLDEEIGRLIGNSETEQHQHEVEGQEDNKIRESKSSTSVGGPKVLAKKIWKNCKKSLHKGEQNRQSHRAEVDSDAAVVRSLEASKSLEEQEFLQMGCPKQGVEPILEGNEDDIDNGGNSDTNQNKKEHRPSMAQAWDNISPTSQEKNPSNSQSNNVTEQKILENDEAFIHEAQSVEVSSHHSNNKASQRHTVSLSTRLKRIQKGAYFKYSKNGTKSTRVSNRNDGENKSANFSSAGSVNTEKSSTSNAEANRKPKQIWKSVVDPKSGRTYYYHRKTRETTWKKPDAFKQYEVEYRKWLEATAGPSTSTEMVSNETKNEEGNKGEGMKSTASANAVGKNEKSNIPEVQQSSTPPTEKKTMNPVQVSAGPTKESTKQDLNIKQKDNVGQASIAEKIAEKKKETKARAEDNKKTIDESNPFDESTPFDEPIVDDDGPGLLFLPKSPARFGRTMTYMSKASARSALTDRTEKIRNTGKSEFSSINPITESTATSVSSYNQGIPSNRVPSRVPVHRERQLMVEELTDARLSAESYEGKSGERRGRIVRGRAREVEPAPEAIYDGDNETLDDFGTSTFDNDTYGTDSVSALSENDTDYLSRRDNFDQARRRALDAAIEIEDWDLAAALSDGMRAVNLPGGYEKAHSSWNQSELDKFIANNDWNAVKSYIARMREQSKKEQGSVSSNRKGQTSSANKRVGSRSQIQHREMMSESSWSGSDSQSSYETYDSESEI